LFGKVEKRAVSLYREQWAIIELIAKDHADATGDRPNISMALRRILIDYVRYRQPENTEPLQVGSASSTQYIPVKEA
jgi:hypothetical protein